MNLYFPTKAQALALYLTLRANRQGLKTYAFMIFGTQLQHAYLIKAIRFSKYSNLHCIQTGEPYLATLT